MGKISRGLASEITHFQYIPCYPMLFHVNTILTDFCWCFHVHECTNCVTKTYVRPIGAIL